MDLITIKEHLEKVIDPTLKKTLLETEGIKHLNFDEETGIVTAIIAIGKLGTDDEKNFRREIAKIIKLDLGCNGIKLEIEEHKVYNGITRRPITFIGIASGKGGVGKSTVTANLAYRFMKKGFKVGVIDADIYGSSIPTLLEMEHEALRMNNNKKIMPLKKGDIEVISTEFFTKPGQAVIWRGGMLNSMLNHFFYDVAWDNKMQVMLIDLPPGTGDVALDVKNAVPQASMIIVTTPHPSASHVAVKAGYASKSMNHDIIGVIENMSHYINPVNKEKEFIFGSGGGLNTAVNLETELLAQIPINQPKYHQSLYEIDEEIGQIYDDLVDDLIFRLNIK